jgi:MFS family permease
MASEEYFSAYDPSEPTNLQKLRGIPWSISFNVFNTFFIQFTFFGSVFILFLDALQLEKTQIGFILALLPFFDLVSLFLASAVSRHGYKRTFLTFWGVRTVFSAGLLLVPAVMGQFGQPAVILFIALIVIAFATSRSIAITAFMPWQQEYIPRTMWGKYSATNTMFTSLAGVVAVSLAGYAISQSESLSGYMLLFAAALAFGALSVWSAARIPGGAPRNAPDREAPAEKGRRETLQDGRFRSYLIGASLISLATIPLATFVPLFMQDVVGISAGEIVYLQTGVLIGGLVSVYLWGWAADRYGSRPVMLWGVVFTAVLPLMWLLMPKQSVWSFPIAMGISLLRGALINSWAIGSVRMLNAFVVPAAEKVPYMAVYTAWMGIVAGVSQLAGGWVLDFTAGVSGDIGGVRVDEYTVFFAISMALAGLSGFYLRRVRVDSRVSIGQFAGMFVQGNPLLAMGSLIRYQFARDEASTVVVTESLGRSGSPLTVDELLEALRDPRFYVRFEAIVSIARRPADERLIAALVDVLRGNDPSLSVIAAWALGRIGDPQAVGPLRESLNSSYRSIRAHAARSLGSLDDHAAGQELLRLLRNESDHGLRIAYAAALGRLEEKRAVPDLLGLLGEETEAEARQELALALARMVGDENHFILLMRSLRDDPGTTLSQELLALRKKWAWAGSSPEVPAIIENCLEAFSRQDLAFGINLLADLIPHAPGDHYEPTARMILDDYLRQERITQPVRLEYPALALFTLSQGWHARHLPYAQPDQVG